MEGRNMDGLPHRVVDDVHEKHVKEGECQEVRRKRIKNVVDAPAHGDRHHDNGSGSKIPVGPTCDARTCDPMGPQDLSHTFVGKICVKDASFGKAFDKTLQPWQRKGVLLSPMKESVIGKKGGSMGAYWCTKEVGMKRLSFCHAVKKKKINKRQPLVVDPLALVFLESNSKEQEIGIAVNEGSLNGEIEGFEEDVF
ncbi:hypothetical protein AMTR_s00146p00028430 [Amborella trichopoda]|uniref:Uncharacterized protein n=1 Tax=Amborella trichopoda TaxID=13333 RepID=W1PB38_AMBTC|nr:hypothetical protein AMTR_s00146p00028430 [Amborella trichopoda]